MLIIKYQELFNKGILNLGFNEISVVPGASLKLGFDFDFATSDDRIHALEAGACLDVYYKELEILANEYIKKIHIHSSEIKN